MDVYRIVLTWRRLLAPLALSGSRAYEMSLAYTRTGFDSTPVGEFFERDLR